MSPRASSSAGEQPHSDQLSSEFLPCQETDGEGANHFCVITITSSLSTMSILRLLCLLFPPPFFLVYSLCQIMYVCCAQLSNRWNIYYQKLELHIFSKFLMSHGSHCGCWCQELCSDETHLCADSLTFHTGLWNILTDCKRNRSLVSLLLFSIWTTWKQARRKCVSSFFTFTVKMKRGWHTVDSCGCSVVKSSN